MKTLHQTYTHGLSLQLGHIPAGYFPIGSAAHLQKLAQDHIKSGASQHEAQIFELKKTPDFTRPRITKESLRQKMSRVMAGNEEIELSTNDLRHTLAAPMKNIEMLSSMAQKVLTSKGQKGVDALNLAAAFAIGQQLVSDLSAAGEELVDAMEKPFWNVKTEDYIRNDHGVFVSKAWLENPENAARTGTVKFKTSQNSAPAATL